MRVVVRRVSLFLQCGECCGEAPCRARSEIPSPARSFAATFAALQEQRHAADYDPHSRFARSEVIELLDTVETVTESFLQMPRRERRAVAVLVLMQERPTG